VVPLVAQERVLPIWGWSIVVIGLLVGAFVAVAWMRRRMLNRSSAGMGAVFSLSELRQMRQSGQIDDEQYEKLRESIIGAARHAIPPDGATPPSEPRL
jgi:uncharacterized membrane protein